MKKIILAQVAGLIFLGTLAALLAEPPPAIPGLDQKQIDAAIAKGVKYLKTSQNQYGTWGTEPAHSIGYAALPGLTLLECGVSPKDNAVQKAAAFVRKYVPKLNSHSTTYEVSLTILFLDRLGEAQDKELIRTLALRLVAGQTSAGGWGYFLPLLTKPDMDKLYAFLERNRLKSALSDPLAKKQTDMGPLAGKKDLKLLDPFAEDKELYAAPLVGDKGTPAAPPAGEKVVPVPPAEAAPPAAVQKPKMAAPKAPDKGGTLRPDFLPKYLQNIPAVANQGKAKGKAVLRPGRDDNSNSQFAMLALWAARRHGVPADQSLLLAYQRFYITQHAEGGWGYMNIKMEQTPSMTCVGLLGLALGHGSAPDVPQAKGPQVVGQTTKEDQAIQNGLKALAVYLGQPSLNPGAPGMENLYFLWSVERVAMLYKLKTIGGKDWYGWGAQILVPNQQGNGSWESKPYHGFSPTIDTCFALLFLKRSNLVQDLTDSLQLYMGITDPSSRNK